MDADEVTVYCRRCGGYGTVGADYVWLLPKCPGCRAELIVSADAVSPLDWRPIWEPSASERQRQN
jgi:hypothetical protein